MLLSLSLAVAVAACVPEAPDPALEAFVSMVRTARGQLAADGGAFTGRPLPGKSLRGQPLPVRPRQGPPAQGRPLQGRPLHGSMGAADSNRSHPDSGLDSDQPRPRPAASSGKSVHPLWGRPLTGEWLAFRRDGQAMCGYATTRPGGDGFAPVVMQHGDTLWAGVMPTTISPANTSISWTGRRWAGIVLPLPRDSAAGVRLLIHELVHTLQPSGDDTAGTFMPLPVAQEGGDGSDQLEGAEGRTLLRLELRALTRALETSGEARLSAARDALLFRHARYARTSAREQQRQRGLDVAEGLPEYTGWRLTAGADGARAGVARALLAADRRAEDTTSTMSFTRGFPYLTGPAYALLLDELAPDWRAHMLRAGAAADLQGALGRAIDPELRQASVDSVASHAATGVAGAAGVASPRGVSSPAGAAGANASPATIDSAAATAAIAYDGDAVSRFETARWRRLEAARRAVRERYLTGPTLRLRPGALRISFDPNGQTSLGAEGTVMRGVVWKGEGDAELLAPAGALVTADWAELRVPLDPATARQLEEGSAGAITLQGEGWSLRLPAGWRLERTGTNWVARPDRAP